MHFSSSSAAKKRRRVDDAEVLEASGSSSGLLRASSNRDRSTGTGRRISPSRRHDAEGNRKSKSGQKKGAKEFAWMDSDDDDKPASDGSKAGSTRSQSRSRSPSLPLPSSASEVQTLSQMVRMTSTLLRAARSMPMKELAAVCQAAARVRYYDGVLFDAVRSAVLSHLRGRGPHDSQHVVDIVAGLADINAYNAEVFDQAVEALSVFADLLSPLLRRRLLDACSKTKHPHKAALLRFLAEKEREARYESSCLEVAAEWQVNGCKSGPAMSLGM